MPACQYVGHMSQPYGFKLLFCSPPMTGGPATSVVSLLVCVLLTLNVVVEREKLGDLFDARTSSTSTTSLPAACGAASRSAPPSTTSSEPPSTTRPERSALAQLRSTLAQAAAVNIEYRSDSYSLPATVAIGGGWLVSALFGVAAGVSWASRGARPAEPLPAILDVEPRVVRVRASQNPADSPAKGVITPSTRRKLVKDGQKL